MATVQSVQQQQQEHQHQQNQQSGYEPTVEKAIAKSSNSKIHKALAMSTVSSLAAAAPVKALSDTATVIRNSLGLAPLSSAESNTKSPSSFIRIHLSRQSSHETLHTAASKPLPPTPVSSSGNNDSDSSREMQPSPQQFTTSAAYPISTHSLMQLYQQALGLTDAEEQLQHMQYITGVLETHYFGDEHEHAAAHEEIRELQTRVRRLLKRLASPRGFSRPGYAPAQLYLGNCYGEGRNGLEANAYKAFQYYWMGSKQNHAECMYRVAVCYEFGAGTRRSAVQATHCLHKAARMGFLPAMYKLGMMLLHRNTLTDRRQGISWLKRAIQHDYQTPQPSVLHALALACEAPDYALVPDIGYALELYQQAAALGHAPSQVRLATAYEIGDLGCPVDHDQALLWAEQAAAQGDPEAAFCLSRWCLSQETNDQEAFQWAEQAARSGSARAMLAMAYYKEHGVGTTKDVDEARLWLDRAAEHNDELALQRIRELRQQERHQRRPCHIM